MNNTDATAKKEKEDAGGKTVVKPKPTGGFAWRMARREFPVLAVTMLLTLGVSALELYLPIVMGEIIDYTVGDYGSGAKREGIARGMKLTMIVQAIIQTW